MASIRSAFVVRTSRVCDSNIPTSASHRDRRAASYPSPSLHHLRVSPVLLHRVCIAAIVCGATLISASRAPAQQRPWGRQSNGPVVQVGSRAVQASEELLTDSREAIRSITRVLASGATHRAPFSGSSRTGAARTSARRPSVVPASPPVRLVAEAEHRAQRALLPIVDDEAMAELLASNDLIFYSEEEMPRAFAKWNGLSAGVHNAYYNISAERGEPFGNGNREFPWDGAAGTHRSRNFETIHFVYLPRDERGELLPIVYQTQGADAQGAGEVAWRYPHGTVFGECLLVKFGQNETLPCELRIRRRVEGDWEVDVFRPFPTASHLADRIQAIRPEWETDATLVELIHHLQNPNTLKRATLRDDHPVRTFDQVAGIDELPMIDSELSATLLETTAFVSCLNTTWKTNDAGLSCHAPTTRHTEQIVPVNYDGGFVAVDSVSCLRCHATVGENVSRFQSQREWYGVIRGSDGIFSFHPFDRSGISNNGQSVPVVLRRDWQQVGILQAFDPKKHPSTHYSVFRP